MTVSADDLYGLPLADFIPERDALARRLRADGDKDGAAAVKALRKPSVAAWAVNQVVRENPDGLEELLTAGDALRSASSGPELREATARERAAVEQLVRATRGLSAAAKDAVRSTLHAAASDDEARAEVAAGTVVKEREMVGLGFGLMSAAAASRPSAPKAPPAEEPAAAEKDAAPPPRPRAAPKRAAAADDAAAKAAREETARLAKERAATRKQLLTDIRAAKAEAGRLHLALTTAERGADAAQAAAVEAQRRVEAAFAEMRKRDAAVSVADDALAAAERALRDFDG